MWHMNNFYVTATACVVTVFWLLCTDDENMFTPLINVKKYRVSYAVFGVMTYT